MFDEVWLQVGLNHTKMFFLKTSNHFALENDQCIKQSIYPKNCKNDKKKNIKIQVYGHQCEWEGDLTQN